MAANSKLVTAEDTISPKVFWPVAVGLLLTFAGSFLAAVTPEMLGALGPFAVPMAMGLTALAAAVTGYLKSDRLRAIGVEATSAVIATAPTSETVPPVMPPQPGEDLQLEDLQPAGADLQPAGADPAGELRDEVATVRGEDPERVAD